MQCEEYEDDTEDNFQNIWINVFNERGANNGRYDTWYPEEDKYPFVPMCVGEWEPTDISKYMVDGYQ